MTDVDAASGSPADIQTAIDSLAGGDGNIHIPAGTYTFNPPHDGKGVIIPFSSAINITGAGIGVTILEETVDGGNSTMFQRDWSGESVSGGKLRISGISFKGYVVNDAPTNNGIVLRCSKDFRIDHCAFQDFANTAIYADSNTGNTHKLIGSGVIDHCTFDNPYHDNFLPKNPAAEIWSVWGYGIIVVGDGYTWNNDISSYLGLYPNVVGRTCVYIEDNTFTRCRHSISSNGMGWYVVRRCSFNHPKFGQVDVHGNAGGSPAAGGRGLEVYDNIFDLTDNSYSEGQQAAIYLRGGGGVAYDNVVTVPNTGLGYGACTLLNDGESAPYDVQQFYWYDNTVQYADLSPYAHEIQDNGGYTEDVNYFLRAPTLIDDGFTYSPYDYPHPLTEEGGGGPTPSGGGKSVVLPGGYLGLNAILGGRPWR